MPPLRTVPPHDLKFAIIAVDTVCIAIIDDAMHVRLIETRADEYTGRMALPGGLISPDETADEAAARHLGVKGGITSATIEQLYTFSGVNRDKRGRVVAVAHLALIPEETALLVKPTEWGGAWAPVKKLPLLAYDHAEIVTAAVERLRSRITYSNIAHALLPKTFTLTDLQTVYQIVLGRDLDKRNFRRKVLSLGLLKETGETAMEGAHRPAALYKFQTTKPVVIDMV